MPGVSLTLWGPGRGRGCPSGPAVLREECLSGGWLAWGWGSRPLLRGQLPHPKPELGSLAGNPSGTGIAFQSSDRLAGRNPGTRGLGWEPHGWDSTCAPSLSSHRPPPIPGTAPQLRNPRHAGRLTSSQSRDRKRQVS